jgi:hypothetical protein
MALSKIKSDSIDSINAAKIPNLDASKITTGTVDNARITLDAAEIPNLDAAKITTGSMANDRVPASAVTQHVTATDLTPIRQDLAMLALYNAVSDNRAAYNLPSSFIDQFEDDTGLTTQTDCDRSTSGEYVSTITSTVAAQHTVTKVGSVSRSSTQAQFGTYSMYCSGAGQGLSFPNHADFDFGSGDWTVDYWIYPTTVGKHHVIRDTGSYPAYLIGEANNTFYASSTGSSWTPINNMNMSSETLNTWQHYAVVREGNVWTTYKDGTRIATVTASGTLNNRNGALLIGAGSSAFDYLGYMDEVRLSKGIARYSGASFILATEQHVTDSYTSLLLHMDDTGLVDSSGSSITASATGTLISDTQTAPTATTKMSGVILYKDHAGTATLGTDLKIYLSANNGGAWTEAASYGAVTPLFSTGVKMVRLGETTVTSGTAPVIKAVWANQASGSKESQLHGWAMNY